MKGHSGTVLTLFLAAFLLRVWQNGSLTALWSATTNGTTGGKTTSNDASHAVVRLAATALALGILLAMADSDAYPIAIGVELVAIIYLLLHLQGGPVTAVQGVLQFITPKGKTT